MNRFSLSLVTLLAVVGGSSLPAQQRAAAPAQAASALARSVDAANKFIATLDDGARAKALFPFDSPQLTNWSNLPGPMFQRHSLRVGDMTPAQRDATFALLQVVLSKMGYEKVQQIMNGDDVLKSQGGGRTGGRQAPPGGGGGGRPGPPPGGGQPAGPGGPGGGGGRRGGGGGGVTFGRDEYYMALLGTPSTTTPWRVQFGGHHLGINITIAGAHAVMTPSLPAAQPAKYVLNGETIRPLGRENDKGFALINALDASQRERAILPYQVGDLVLGPLQDGKTIQPEGILASALTPAQQDMLLDIAHEWVGILNDEAAAERMAELRTNLPKTYFAWSGATTNGGLAYYRIQGPTVVIEYAPQQGDLDHIHTIYRDPTNDYGAKLVAR